MCSSILNTSQMSPLDSDMVIDSMVATGQLREELRSKVREAMLKKHHHQNERKLSNRIPLVRSIADIGKKHSDPLLLERNGETPLALLFLFHPCSCQFPPPAGRDEAFPLKTKSTVQIPRWWQHRGWTLTVSSTGENVATRSHPGEKEIWVLATVLTCMAGLASPRVNNFLHPFFLFLFDFFFFFFLELGMPTLAPVCSVACASSRSEVAVARERAREHNAPWRLFKMPIVEGQRLPLKCVWIYGWYALAQHACCARAVRSGIPSSSCCMAATPGGFGLVWRAIGR